MSRFRILLVVTIFIQVLAGFGFAATQTELDSAKNYIFILAHSRGVTSGIYDGRQNLPGIGGPFSHLKQYLETELDLEGYVYSYDFTNVEDTIEHQGWELGDRNYNNPGAVTSRNSTSGDDDDYKTTRDGSGKGRCWLEQAKEDFKANFYNKNKRDPDPTEIPNKYILITHCFGGLATRHYVYGTGSNGQRYYHNDIKKVLLISVPNEGANGVEAYYVWKDYYSDLGSLFFPMLGATITAHFTFHNPKITCYMAIATGYTIFTPIICNIIANQAGLKETAGFDDMRPGSAQLAALNSKTSAEEYNALYPLPIEKATVEAYNNAAFSIIAGSGVPTASKRDLAMVKIERAVPIYMILDNLLNNAAGENSITTIEGKILSFILSMAAGYQATEDGDFWVQKESVDAYNVPTLNNAKRYSYTFNNPALLALETGTAALIVMGEFIPEEWSKLLFYFCGGVTLATVAGPDAFRRSIASHGNILDVISTKPSPPLPYNTTDFPAPLLEQALFDTPLTGDTHCPGEKYFKLFSDFSTAEGKFTGVFHEVSLEAYGAGNSGKVGVSVAMDGKRKNVEYVNVKEPPTRIEGVLRDFMPLKMQFFQYSENFAAWKDIKILNEWGHFQIDGLKLAEGQNMIAFRAKNKVGYESNQHLKIVLNTMKNQYFIV